MAQNESKFKEKFLKRKEVLAGKFLTWQVDEVLLPNGQISTREVVRHPGAVAVLPLLPSSKLVLVRQFRYALEKVIYEIPAGKLDQGELPLACAKRELQEETGYQAKTWQQLGSIYTVPGFCDEIIHIFKAEGLVAGVPQPDEDEVIELLELTPEQIKELVQKGKICDAKTLAALFLLGVAR